MASALSPRPVNSSVGLLLIHARLKISKNTLSGELHAGSSLNISGTLHRSASGYVAGSQPLAIKGHWLTYPISGQPNHSLDRTARERVSHHWMVLCCLKALCTQPVNSSVRRCDSM